MIQQFLWENLPEKTITYTRTFVNPRIHDIIKKMKLLYLLFFSFSFYPSPVFMASINQDNGQYLYNFYITIKPQLDAIDDDNYSLITIQWILDIKQILDTLFKYENNTDNKIQLQKYQNIILEHFISIVFLKFLWGKKINQLNHKIHHQTQQKIFPMIKKINKLMGKSKNKILIKNMYEIRKYIFNGLLKNKPVHLNNYVININLIKNLSHGYGFFKNTKDFLFYLKTFVQSIIELWKNKIISSSYKRLQTIVNQLSKLIDEFSKLLLMDNLTQINSDAYEEQIEQIVQQVNEILEKTSGLSTYKTLEKFNDNLTHNNNCIEYITGYYQDKHKQYYQLLLLKDEFFFLKKYHIKAIYNHTKLDDIIHILKIIHDHENNPSIKKKIESLQSRHSLQKSREKAWEAYQQELVQAQKKAQEKTEKMLLEKEKKQQEKQLKKLKKIEELLEKKQQEALAIQLQKQEEFKKKMEEKRRQWEEERQKKLLLMEEEKQKKQREEEERLQEQLRQKAEAQRKKEEEEKKNYKFLNNKDKINNVASIIEVSNKKNIMASPLKGKITMEKAKSKEKIEETSLPIQSTKETQEKLTAINQDNNEGKISTVMAAIPGEQKTPPSQIQPQELFKESNFNKQNPIEENPLNSPLEAVEEFVEDVFIPEIIAIDMENITQQVEEEIIQEEKKIKADSYDYILMNSNEESLINYNYNLLQKTIQQPQIPKKDILFYDEKSFYQFIEEVNQIIETSTININYFREFIEKKLLIPHVQDAINNYYVQDVEPHNNQKLLQELMVLVHQDMVKKKLIQILNKLDEIIKEKSQNTLLISKKVDKLKSMEKTIFTSKKITININESTVKNYLVFINFQIKKLYNLDHPLVKKFPNNIQNHNMEAVQSLIINLSGEEWDFFEQNDILLITHDQYKSLMLLIQEYENISLMDNKLSEKLLAINYQINEMISGLNITSNWAQFIIDLNEISNFYGKYSLPLLKKK
jgi:hypothetical protein